MGVTGLLSSDEVKRCKKTISLDELRGKRCAFDTSVWMRRFVYGLMPQERQRWEERYNTFMERMRGKHAIRLVAVFDGPPPPWKQPEIDARRKVRSRNRDDFEQAEEDLEEARNKRQKLATVEMDEEKQPAA